MRTFQPHLLLAFLFFVSHVLSSASNEPLVEEEDSRHTLLHKAALEGHEEIVAALLRKYFDESQYEDAGDAEYDELKSKLKDKDETFDDDAKEASVDGNTP